MGVADKGLVGKAKYRHDTSHLSPTNFDLTVYMWNRPVTGVGRGHTMDIYWGANPPDVHNVRLRASGTMSRYSRVFDVHLVIALDDAVPIQTWASMGMLAKTIQMELEREHVLVCKPIDRTVIDVDYTSNKNHG